MNEICRFASEKCPHFMPAVVIIQEHTAHCCVFFPEDRKRMSNLNREQGMSMNTPDL